MIVSLALLGHQQNTHIVKELFCHVAHAYGELGSYRKGDRFVCSVWKKLQIRKSLPGLRGATVWFSVGTEFGKAKAEDKRVRNKRVRQVQRKESKRVWNLNTRVPHKCHHHRIEWSQKYYWNGVYPPPRLCKAIAPVLCECPPTDGPDLVILWMTDSDLPPSSLLDWNGPHCSLTFMSTISLKISSFKKKKFLPFLNVMPPCLCTLIWWFLSLSPFLYICRPSRRANPQRLEQPPDKTVTRTAYLIETLSLCCFGCAQHCIVFADERPVIYV